MSAREAVPIAGMSGVGKGEIQLDVGEGAVGLDQPLALFLGAERGKRPGVDVGRVVVAQARLGVARELPEDIAADEVAAGFVAPDEVDGAEASPPDTR